jgi:SAM-dependent methyltransferase
MIDRISINDIRDITATAVVGMSDHDRDEMAIPSYLHQNPMIRWLMWRRYDVIADFIDGKSEQTVLEFGCGMGLFLPELNRCFDRVLAIDLFPQYAKALNERRTLNTQFVAAIDEISESEIDVIVAADVLEHLEDLPAYLNEFRTILRNGGRLLVSGPTENLIYQLGRVAAGFGGKGDYHHTNIDRLIEDIATNGFSHTRTVGLPFPILPNLFKICEFTKN